MKAQYDDTVKVQPVPMFDEVWVSTKDADGNAFDLMLTPKQARKLARKINRAASVIEIKQGGRTIV